MSRNCLYLLLLLFISAPAFGQEAVKSELDTVKYDVDMRFEGRRMDLFSRYDGKIIIYNVLGRVVTNYEITQGNSSHYLWNVPYGCYFVSVIANKRRTTVRVILD